MPTMKTVRRTVPKRTRRPTVAPKPKVPQVKPLPPTQPVRPVPQTHASPLPPVVAVPVQVAPKKESAKIWEEIKDLPINMFGLPNQTVSMHVTPVSIEPSKLYLLIRSSATLPSLEDAIKGKFSVELSNKYVIVTRTA